MHGAPLGEEELKATKESLGWPLEPRFLVPDDVRALWAEVVARQEGRARGLEAARRGLAERRTPSRPALLDAHVDRTVPADLAARLLEGAAGADATRKLSQAHHPEGRGAGPVARGRLGRPGRVEPHRHQGRPAASLPGSFAARNVHYGIREHAMGAIANGLAYDGLYIPFVGTFFVFSDYMRPPVRLAALAKLQVIYVWTHDSIFLGEDGPTHQPVEHLTAVRAIPNLHVVRPADGLETALAWAHALTRREGPTALVLTRQKIARIERPVPFDPAKVAARRLRGRRPARREGDARRHRQRARHRAGRGGLLAAKGIAARLVSVPCLTCFEAQPEAVRREVIPAGQRVAVVEAGRGIEWWRLVGSDGLVIGIDRFGASAPEKSLAETYGFTPAKVAARIEGWLSAEARPKRKRPASRRRTGRRGQAVGPPLPAGVR